MMRRHLFFLFSKRRFDEMLSLL